MPTISIYIPDEVYNEIAREGKSVKKVVYEYLKKNLYPIYIKKAIKRRK